MTHLRKLMLEEPERRNFTDSTTNSASTEHSQRFRIPRPSQRGFVRCSAPNGWLIQNVPLAVRNMRFATSVNTPIGWPFQTIDSSHSPMATSLSAGAIPLTRTKSV